MEQAFAVASLWLAMAVLAAIIAYHLKVSIALVEICVGVAAGAVAGAINGGEVAGAQESWLRFLAAAGAVMLTFLAGAELDPAVMRSKVREVSLVGLVGFAAPFFGCAAVAHWALGWDGRASWLAGIALSTTSMAVVYAVMLETGLNQTEFGKGILGACFLNDLATVLGLGLLFAPFTWRSAVFVLVAGLGLVLLPLLTRRMTTLYAHRTAAIRAKWVLLVLFGLGALALWAGSEAVLPAYVAGMALAGSAARDDFWVRRMRTLTIGFLTPFYFLRAGTLVSVPALAAAPWVLMVLLAAKVGSKIFGLYPVVAAFRQDQRERWYYTLLMSTGLTFGTISALYGLTHGIVTPAQYSYLVAAVIASAVVPTLVATKAFLPRHLLPAVVAAGVPEEGPGDEG